MREDEEEEEREPEYVGDPSNLEVSPLPARPSVDP